VVALKNRPDHQVDADGERRSRGDDEAADRWMVLNFLQTAMTALLRHMDESGH
jgi:hypothetical protein